MSYIGSHLSFLFCLAYQQLVHPLTTLQPLLINVADEVFAAFVQLS